MDTVDAIRRRRSIRQFRSDPIPKAKIEAVLDAACRAPSAKNTQPWHFVVFEGATREELVSVVEDGVSREERAGRPTGDSRDTLHAMRQAPVIILVFNRESSRYADLCKSHLPRAVDVQSIGASIQNMLLAAANMGLGSLWICDVLYAYDALLRFGGPQEELVAAVAIGYANEQPVDPPRRPLAESVTWAV